VSFVVGTDALSLFMSIVPSTSEQSLYKSAVLIKSQHIINSNKAFTTLDFQTLWQYFCDMIQQNHGISNEQLIDRKHVTKQSAVVYQPWHSSTVKKLTILQRLLNILNRKFCT
jgi:hypothetical protein